MRNGDCHRSERCQRGAVQQTEEKEREGDGTEARTAPPAPAHDRDADHLVTPARQCDAADRGCSARRRQREHGGPLAAQEQALPAPGLRSVGTEQDHPGEPDEPEVRVMERPARPREVAHDESRHHESREDEDGVEKTLQREGQLPGHRQLRPYVVSESSLAWGSSRSEMPPSAFVSSLGITHTLFASPWAIWGRTWRYS